MSQRDVYRSAVGLWVAVIVAVSARGATIGLYGLAGDQLNPDPYLLKIDPNSGQGTIVGTIAHSQSVGDAGMAYDPGRDVLYAVSGSFGTDLLVVDPADASVLSVLPLGMGAVDPGLAFAPGPRVLYMVEETSDDLYTINVDTGEAQSLGDVGVDLGNPGLAFDSGRGLLVGVSGRKIFTIDPQIGPAATWISSDLGVDLMGLAFDPISNLFYASGGAMGDTLYGLVIAPSPSAKEIGGIGFGNVEGLAFIPEPATLALLALGSIILVRRKRKCALVFQK